MKGVILWVMSYALAITSAGWAARYGYKAGGANEYDAWLLAGMLGLVSVFAVHSFALAYRVGRKNWIAGVGIALAGVVCFGVCLAAGVGNYALSTDGNTGARGKSKDDYVDFRATKKRLEGELAGLQRHRPAASLVPLIENAKAHERWKTSLGCMPERITLPETKEHCTAYRDLEAELGAARRAAEIRAELSGLGTKLDSTAATGEVNPHGSALSRVVWGWVDAQTATSWFAFLCSLGMELGAMMSMLSYEITSGGDKNQAASSGRAPGRVQQFLGEAAIPDEDGNIGIDAIYQTYTTWCKARDRTAMALGPFVDDFVGIAEKLGIEVTGSGGRMSAQGVRLQV